MKLNLTDSERSRLGAANLDAFFAHINSSINDPNAIYQIPNGAMVTFQTGDAWVDKQNDLLAISVSFD
ncbi:MAG TPA: hypothetical protein DD379_03465, partial [Cyanobacteria bacterium UBA11162]|nr:hypothetical protein [Cyanobacteria bacterium UBA11162]